MVEPIERKKKFHKIEKQKESVKDEVFENIQQNLNRNKINIQQQKNFLFVKIDTRKEKEKEKEKKEIEQKYSLNVKSQIGKKQ